MSASALRIVEGDPPHGQDQGPVRRAFPDRASVRQGLGDEAGQERPLDGYRDHFVGLARARHRAWRRAACRAAGWWRFLCGRNPRARPRLALHTVAEGQKKGGICAFIDAEHALDPVYARKLGVNIDDLLISQPDTGEQALEICDTLVRSGAVDVLVIDPVAALVPRAELEGEMGDALPGLQARLMSCRRCAS